MENISVGQRQKLKLLIQCKYKTFLCNNAWNIHFCSRLKYTEITLSNSFNAIAISQS